MIKDKKNELISSLIKLRILLIITTLIQVTYIIINFSDNRELIKIIFQYRMDYLMIIFHYLIVGIFISFIWKKLPSDKKSNTNNTLMILFLGIIGMWIWIPNKNELKNYVND